MRNWGMFLIIMAAGSAILPRFGIQFIILAWIDQWGETTAWVIRGVLAAIGAGLLIKSRRAGG